MSGNDAPGIASSDLGGLTGLFPHLHFERDEQLQVLRSTGSADFQAAPGSGKTTLLGVKLALLATKWPHVRRGICVLTHTNVARDEISACLKSAAQGADLLSYPHYLGTIQSWVNRYLAVPWLKSLGIKLREIDDDEVVDAFVKRALDNPAVSGWYSYGNSWDKQQALRSARYVGAQLQLVAEGGRVKLPVDGMTISTLRSIKAQMAKSGSLRHEDMYAYAEQALACVPGLGAAAAHRFPNVFMDEMQDTSDAQKLVLSKVFDGRSEVQRFGDVNQSILYRGRGEDSASFPSPGSLQIRTSLRFGSEIAAVINTVRVAGLPIVGMGPVGMAPVLFLYTDKTITGVIAEFGRYLARHFSAHELCAGPIKAVCAIKRRGNESQPPGRNILDYAPDFDLSGKPASSRRSVVELVSLASFKSSPSVELHERISAARTLILLIIQHFGRPILRNVSTWRNLLGVVEHGAQDINRLDGVALRLVSGEYDTVTCDTAIRDICTLLNDIVPAYAPEAPIPSALASVETTPSARTAEQRNYIPVFEGGARFQVQLGTIAAVKGESHLATLVLESCRQKIYDLSSLLPFLCGDSNTTAPVSDAVRERMLNVFVAASRPRKLLAFAMHSDRVTEMQREKLTGRGWTIFQPAGEQSCPGGSFP